MLGIGAAAGAAFSIPLIVFAFVSMGGGHGSYTPMKVCFPYTMALVDRSGSITLLLILLGLVQYPVYGALLAWFSNGRQPRLGWLVVLAIHVSVVILAFIRSEFSR